MNLRKTIIKLLEVAEKERIIKNIEGELFNYNDEPRVHSFIIKIKDISNLTDGFVTERFRRCASFSKRRALLKTVAETLERYNLAVYRKKDLLWESYSNLKDKAINPRQFISFSKAEAVLNFHRYKDHNEKLNWIRGTSLITGKKIFVPAQLVFVPYKFEKKESVINFPITTGAALYHSLEKAILTGLLEVIERDAFMVNYLNKLTRNLISITESKDKSLKKIASSLKRYNLELYLLDISTDIPVYSIMAIVVDRTGLGPAVSVGLKSDTSIKNAIIGATEECFHPRPWVRELMIKMSKKDLERIKKDRLVYERKNRALLWSSPEMIKKIDFFLAGSKKPIRDFPRKSNNLKNLLKWFKREKMEVIYVDITLPSLKREGLRVVKVLVPCLQPLYLDDRFPCWEGERLWRVPQRIGLKPIKDIYTFPHPFL